MKVCSWTTFEFISLVRQRAKRTDDYVNGLKWQHHESTARFRCCKNWSSFYYFKGDPTSSGVKEPREGSPISFSLLHSVQTVIFAGFKIWNLILQDDMCADLNSKSTAQAFDFFLVTNRKMYRRPFALRKASKVSSEECRQFYILSMALDFIIPVTWNNKISLKPKNND